eukprot:630606-Amphidinium_carterae.2
MRCAYLWAKIVQSRFTIEPSQELSASFYALTNYNTAASTNRQEAFFDFRPEVQQDRRRQNSGMTRAL